MARTLVTRTLVVRQDAVGLFIRHGGQVFRPIPDPRPDTPHNRRAEYVPLVAGQKVRVSIDPATRDTSSMGVFTEVDPESAGTQAVWGSSLPPGSGNFVTWRVEAKPQNEIDPAPAFRR